MPLTSLQKIMILNDLEDSNIPFKVDLVDFSQVNEKFKNLSLRSIINV